VLLPKTETPDQVRAVAERVRHLCLECRSDNPVWIMPILETALGIEHAFAIATADESVVALTIGLEDYTADLGVVKTRDGKESLWARSRLVNAARAAGVQAIDSVYGDVDDDDGLRAWALAARAQGFAGMGCVHPRQIRIIHESFAPTGEEITRALRIVEAFRAADAQGLSVVSLGSKMIDPPVVQRAQRIVAQALASGLLKGGGGA
jgi:citrate lyase subunit beta/citryl-CoA lyase